MTAQLLPEQLRCEYLVNPLGIESSQPRLTWVVRATSPAQRALKQTAYQILVASSAEALAADRGDLWDSGKISSPETAQIAYAGQPLASGQGAYWKVRVWDNNSETSNYSDTATWEMGLRQTSDWQGQWIGLNIPDRLANTSEIDRAVMIERNGLRPAPYLRRNLSLTRPVSQARLYITAKGLYEAHLNGQRIGDAWFSPGWTDYNKRIQYQTYDVTSQIQQGENVLGIVVGTGWYCGHVGFNQKDNNGFNLYGQEPRVLLQLQISYADGGSETIVSDANWRGTTGPIVYSDFLAGECYDARRELAGWDTPGLSFSDHDWQPVATEPRGTTDLLVCEPAEPVRVTEQLTPQSVNEITPGVQIFDLGQNMVGWVSLRVQGEAGRRVQLRFAEILNPDGTIYTTNLRAARQTDTYILKGEGEEVFEPHFTFHGFRYVEVTGYPGQPELNALTGQVAHSATPPIGTFETSSPLVNQLQHNIVWGQRGNFLSVPTDCPQRDERLGWTGDGQIFVRTASYNMDVAAFFTKWMDDVVDAQSPEGGFSDVAPRLVDMNDGAPAWGDVGIIVPWTIYQMFGDTRVIERHYIAMTHWIEYIDSANPSHLWLERRNNDFGDWLSIETRNNDFKALLASEPATPKDLLATAYFAYDSLLLSRMARAIGRNDDAEKYQRLYRSIVDAFNKAYVSEDGRIKGNTQTCYVLALHMQLLPEHLRPLAARHLVEAIEARDWHLSTGFVGVGYLCPVLTEAGYADVAYRLLNNETFPSWGYSIKHGATTIWERWDGWTNDLGFQDPGMNSFNHYSLGSVGQWLYQYVAGIDVNPERPGLRHIVIHPYPGGGLSYARAEYRSLHGLIRSGWEIGAGNTLTVRVTIPANATATVSLPVREKQVVYEGASQASQTPGVTFQREEKGRQFFKIGSGDYEFHVR
jgi:alpha-L-rhamnosidase